MSCSCEGSIDLHYRKLTDKPKLFEFLILPPSFLFKKMICLGKMTKMTFAFVWMNFLLLLILTSVYCYTVKATPCFTI